MSSLLRAETPLTQPQQALCYTGSLRRTSKALESSWIWICGQEAFLRLQAWRTTVICIDLPPKTTLLSFKVTTLILDTLDLKITDLIFHREQVGLGNLTTPSSHWRIGGNLLPTWQSLHVEATAVKEHNVMARLSVRQSNPRGSIPGHSQGTCHTVLEESPSISSQRGCAPEAAA